MIVFYLGHYLDAVVVTMYNTMTTIAATKGFTVKHVLMAILSFITVSGGGIIIGLVFGAFTSMVTKFTSQVRGKSDLCDI